jgi:serine/threonine protein kinase
MTLKDDIRTGQSVGSMTIGGIKFIWDEDDNAFFGQVSEDAYITLIPKKASIQLISKSSDENEPSVSHASDVSDVLSAIKHLKARVRQQLSLQKRSGLLASDDVEQLFGRGSLGRAMKLFSAESDLISVLNKVLPGMLPKGIGKKLGSGGEGQVFEYGPDRVIKIYIVDNINAAKSTLRTLERIRKRNIPCIARIFDAGFIGRLIIPHKDVMGKQVMTDEFLIYVFYYISEKLEEFHPTDEQIKSVIKCLDDNHVAYDDVVDNLMIDKDGNPKLADIGRFINV